jgi:predicted nucleic acid-binding protein
MSGYLLDTNVVSELSKPAPHAVIVTFLDTEDDLWLSVIVLEELELGVRLLTEGRRRDRLRAWLSQLVLNFAARILPVERKEAEQAAALQAKAHRTGKGLQLADALIAGTAATHDLVVATRNVRDFDGLGIDVFNPWQMA